MTYGVDMDNILDFIRNNIKVFRILLIVVVVVLIIMIIKKIVKKRQNAKELSMQAADKIRDENLNNVILNSHGVKSNARDIPIPYDVDYSNQSGNGNEIEKNANASKSPLMIQMVEKTNLSTRKFILNPEKGIRIGSDTQDNDITVFDQSVSPHQCEIFSAGNKVYIRNIGTENRTILKRKKESVIINENGIRLVSNDRIILGSITYDIRIINH
jgi:pSer/pThr/pTyr-binding forkhead associated (FHA) protein